MEIIISFLISFIITLIATPLVIKFAKKYSLVDDPKKRPHPAHTQIRIIPRAGGLAIYLGIVLSSLLILPLQKYLIGIILGISVLLITGLVDDKVKHFNPYLRLILLFLAAGMAVGSGIGITFITNPLSFLSFLTPTLSATIIPLDDYVYTVEFFGTHNLIIIADILAFLWIVTLTQIINWSKGVDGQMPGITLIASIVLGILSLKFFMLGDSNQIDVARLAFITAGTSFGFLIFNWFPSKILPAFSGSTILAFMLAILAILSGAKIATAILVLAIPTIDFFYTFIRRILSGKSPVWGDRGHLHHKLLDLGWSHQQISLFYMLFSVILGAVALTANPEGKLFAILIVAVLVIGFLLWLNSFGDYSRPRGPDNG